MMITTEDALDLPITFQFVTSSTPAELLQQYYKLRQEVYTDYWKLKHFAGGEDEYDHHAHILLLCQGNRCIGGARLVVHQAHMPTQLPMETAEFKLPALFPDLMLEGENYGEICRAAILHEFRNGRYIKEVYRQMAFKCKELNLKYAFVVGPLLHARKIRISCNALGLYTEMRNDIAVPSLSTYEEIEMRLTISYLESWRTNDVCLSN